jgi:hypothetical protein
MTEQRVEAVARFWQSTKEPLPPGEWSLALQSLWHAARGDWDAAHEIAQALPGAEGAWIHAHLHRQEGDLGNAAYWYRQAQRAMPTTPLAEERETLIEHFLPHR